MQKLIIELATLKDLDSILKITQNALISMKKLGFHQWNENYPNFEIFTQDIDKNHLYICRKKEQILGFVCINELFMEEYEDVHFNPKFNNKALYLHRLAVNQNFKRQGVGFKLLNFCEEFAIRNNKLSLRADTLSKNLPMNSLFKKLNYQFCGEFNIKNYNDKFFAYEKILKNFNFD
ncbi:GNAT family N-acetyltransferase [Campylobacter sp. TTU_617]|uniref:GNAT family N-acetyltransferase n=1 Tax=Campylobacter sp. TTU_617 TaxID=2768148 RepID=UPI0019058359|nr:GNAT family N-acetyltransferase [Campylobacter sp. TTU_617]MBK1971584.1 GNAT family N-acetyltransferase [Campylobacter sp. TTU_617]